MESLYHQSQKLVLDIQDLLPQIDRTVGKDVAPLEHSVLGKLEELASNIQRLDILVNKELPVRRREARLKVDQLKQDRMMLQNAIHILQHNRMKREQETAAREELLRQHSNRTNRSETSVFIDHSLQHHSALNGIHRSLDDIWETGVAALEGLRFQRGVIKKAHRRLLDFTNVISLSNSVMRLIERRSTQDKYLFYGLAILICLIILWSFWYFQH